MSHRDRLFGLISDFMSERFCRELDLVYTYYMKRWLNPYMGPAMIKRVLAAKGLRDPFSDHAFNGFGGIPMGRAIGGVGLHSEENVQRAWQIVCAETAFVIPLLPVSGTIGEMRRELRPYSRRRASGILKPGSTSSMLILHEGRSTTPSTTEIVCDTLSKLGNAVARATGLEILINPEREKEFIADLKQRTAELNEQRRRLKNF